MAQEKMKNGTKVSENFKSKYDTHLLDEYGLITVGAECPQCHEELKINIDIRGIIESALDSYSKSHPIPVLESTTHEYEPIPSQSTIADALNNLADKMDTIINIISDEEAKNEQEIEDFNNFMSNLIQ